MWERPQRRDATSEPASDQPITLFNLVPPLFWMHKPHTGVVRPGSVAPVSSLALVVSCFCNRILCFLCSSVSRILLLVDALPGCGELVSAKEILKGFYNLLWQVCAGLGGQELMACAGDGQQLVLCGNELQRGIHLVQRTEGITCAVHEQRGRCQHGEMVCSQLSGLARRVKRIRKQKQARHQLLILGSQHGRLPPAIRMSPQKNFAGERLAQHLNRAPQALAVFLGAAGKRRSLWTFLTKGQIAAQNHQAGDIGESVAEGDQQLRLAIRAGSVSQYQPVAAWLGGFVDESADRRLTGNINDFANRGFRKHGTIVKGQFQTSRRTWKDRREIGTNSKNHRPTVTLPHFSSQVSILRYMRIAKDVGRGRGRSGSPIFG